MTSQDKREGIMHWHVGKLLIGRYMVGRRPCETDSGHSSSRHSARYHPGTRTDHTYETPIPDGQKPLTSPSGIGETVHLRE